MSNEYLTVVEQARRVACHQVSARDLVEHSLNLIARHNADLNAFVHVMVDEARAEADARDAAVAAGEPLGPLHGVPVAIKDELDVAGVPTRLGTNAVTRPAAADCEPVRRLRAAGAVIVGKTVMPEFGQWPFTESTTYGYTRNPWNPQRSVAGSSGGTAVAVASGMVATGLGGDGGGSMRLPAAWTSLFGVKTQRGRVSTAPNRALWRALGVTGALARTVADSALLHDVLAGNLPTDLYQVPAWPTSLTEAITHDPPHLRVLVAERPPAGRARVEAQTSAVLRRTARLLAEAGHELTYGDLPAYKPGIAFIGQMAGGVTDELKLIDAVRLLEARTRHAVPLYRALAPLAGRAERQADALARDYLRIFEQYDLILMPVVAHPPVPLGVLDGKDLPGTIVASLAQTAYTSIWNLLGNPAASVPAGFTGNGLPLAVQLVVAAEAEPLMYQVAAYLERVAPWDTRHPSLGG